LNFLQNVKEQARERLNKAIIPHFMGMQAIKCKLFFTVKAMLESVCFRRARCLASLPADPVVVRKRRWRARTPRPAGQTDAHRERGRSFPLWEGTV
jgi:hypothetical protein